MDMLLGEFYYGLYDENGYLGTLHYTDSYCNTW